MTKYVWTDKQGRKYTEKDITDSHLVNIIKFLTTKANDLPFPCFDPETEASYYAEQSWEQESGRLSNSICFFRKIAKKRNLSKV